MKKLTLVIVTALVILAAVSVTTSQETTRAADTAEFASNAHGLVEAANEQPAARLPLWQGTGECGYFQNAGTEHRNGLVDPHYCTSEPITVTTEVKHVREDKPAVTVPTTTEQPEQPVVPVIEPEQPETPETPVVVPVTPEPDHCNNGAGNGDDCTPGKSSGSNQGQGQQTGDQTNQGENGNKGGNKPNK